MQSNYISGGCSFTFGNELSDDRTGKVPSKKSWAHGLFERTQGLGKKFINTAMGGAGNPAIARRVFQEISKHPPKSIKGVWVMWTFTSRYDWAMPRHKVLENQRWASISPWDTNMRAEERHQALANSEVQQQEWKAREDALSTTGVSPFANALYRYAANEFHEIYLSWKSIIWLQNILEKKQIPFMFTLADNSLFYKEFDQHKDSEPLLKAMYGEIDFTKWFSFGERMMGFNQWTLLNGYERAVTHPLDKAHADAIMLMESTFNKLIGGKK